MKRDHLPVFLFVFLAGALLFPSRVGAYFFTEEDAEPEVYHNEDFMVVQEEPGMDQFYAMVKGDGYYKYVKYNAYFNQVFNITNFFELGTAKPEVSAIDPYNRRFFFTINDELKSILYVIGLDTGEIIRTYSYEYRIVMMRYDAETERLIGIAQNRHGNNKTVYINTFNGALTRASDLSAVHSLKINTAFLHPKRREIWVIAEKRRAEYLMTVHADTGRANVVKVIQVKPEDWRFYNFNTEQLNQLLFAAGTKDSIILAGFNEQYLTTFIVHLTINSSHVKELIAELQAKIEDATGTGLSDYDLTIVSARPLENFIAYSKAQVLEDNLKREYGVEKIERREFFLGQPYHVISSAEGLGVY